MLLLWDTRINSNGIHVYLLRQRAGVSFLRLRAPWLEEFEDLGQKKKENEGRRDAAQIKKKSDGTKHTSKNKNTTCDIEHFVGKKKLIFESLLKVLRCNEWQINEGNSKRSWNETRHGVIPCLMSLRDLVQCLVLKLCQNIIYGNL